MFLKFVRLEIKSFFRASSLGVNITMKILTVFAMLYFIAIMLLLSLGGYELIESELKQDPLKVLCSGMIYLLVADLFFRFLWQQLSTQNIKPFLTMNIAKKVIVQ